MISSNFVVFSECTNYTKWQFSKTLMQSEVQFFGLWNFLWNFATFHSFLVIKQTISFIIFELNLPKLAKIMGCKLVRLSQPILLDLCLHPSINAFLQDGCRYLLSIFKCSIAQKHSKILFLLFSSRFFSSLVVNKTFWLFTCDEAVLNNKRSKNNFYMALFCR